MFARICTNIEGKRESTTQYFTGNNNAMCHSDYFSNRNQFN